MSIPNITFNDGYTMPMLGLGTAHTNLEEIEEAVKYAIEIGYRHIDTAYKYGSEKYVGKAVLDKIKDGTVKREDLFITTKLWCYAHKKEDVVPACKESLKELNLDYVDLYLIHWPIALTKGDDYKSHQDRGKRIVADIDYIETWKGMEKCKRLGLARSVGISNFNSEQITRLISCSEIKPVNNQVEVSLNINQKSLINFCKKNDITITGYSPLGKPGNSIGLNNLWDEAIIKKLSDKYGKTPAQVTLRFITQMGAAVIPKSVTKARLKENFEIFDFSLSEEEINEVQKIETGRRLITYECAKNDKYYPFNIPF